MLFFSNHFIFSQVLTLQRIFTVLHIYSRILKSYFLRYYFSRNHIKALSIISSYISKIGVNVVYIHFIHRSIS